MAQVSVRVAVAAFLVALPAGSAAQTPAADLAAETLKTYCTGCHSATARSGGVVLVPEAVHDVGADPALWEKVLRKLQTGTMPPSGRRRPDPATYGAVSGFLESGLDRAAAMHPNPGTLPPLRRLTRTEYQNAIRDLLGLDALPKEVDYAYLLPPDSTASGFDNIADLLFVSPTSMESYLNAADKISALAVGDAATPVMVNRYRMPDEHPQDARVEDLPFGTRGGLAARTFFPLDAEYVFRIDFTGRSTSAQELEITVDGERVHLAAIAGAGGGRGGAIGRGGGGRGRGASDSSRLTEVRLPIKAGPHLVGVTFIEKNEARDEDTLRPRMRGTGTELAIELLTIGGPYSPTGPGTTPSRARIFTCRPRSAAEETPCARRILTTLVRRAYRRPALAADVDVLMPFYAAGRAERSFDLGIQRALQRLLSSPQFLFRIERDHAVSTAAAARPVTDLELASRLSFFLWSSIPDDELLEVAVQGRLRQPAVLERQVRRMLADPRSSSLVTNFAEQWLFLRDLDVKQPNELLFPDFDDTLRAAFRRETTLFVDSVLRGGDRSVTELLSANYTFLNERLADHYGIAGVHGSDFRRVTLPADSPRGGLLGQGSLLTITSYANRTSPVNRGKWVLENLLASPPPPPPPNVPALKIEAEKTGAPLTMRDAMIQHRANPTCASCHSRMDPIGFALENFDAIGRWRERDAGQAIDASGVFPNGVAFNGMAELKRALVEHPEEFVSTFADKLLMYAAGRSLQYYDQPVVRAIVREARPANYTFASLVLGVVRSVPFQMRQPRATNGNAQVARQ